MSTARPLVAHCVCEGNVARSPVATALPAAGASRRHVCVLVDDVVDPYRGEAADHWRASAEIAVAVDLLDQVLARRSRTP